MSNVYGIQHSAKIMAALGEDQKHSQLFKGRTGFSQEMYDFKEVLVRRQI